MMTIYKLEKVDLDEKWDLFIKSSSTGTVFSYSEYLNCINKKVAAYFLYKNKEVRAAVALVLDDNNPRSTVLHNFLIYNGIIFGTQQHMQNNAQVISDHFRIMEFIATELPHYYNVVTMRLHPTVKDIRPFLWYNFGTAKPKYTVDIRYTSHVNIEELAVVPRIEDTVLYFETLASRRQELRYAMKKGVITREDFQVDNFTEFYSKTMQRQNIKVGSEYLGEMRTILVNLYKAGLGRLYVAYTADGQAGSMAFFCVDNKRAYYIFGANDPNLRDSHTGTAVLWDSFRFLSKDGVKEVDMEGVNSPQRGWFKLSFGGAIDSYYVVRLKL